MKLLRACRDVIDSILRKRRIRKVCKANNYCCPDCIFHEHIFAGSVFLGTRCRLENRR